MKFIVTVIAVIFLHASLMGQMKVMDPSVYSEWNRIQSEVISNDGKWVKYHLVPGKGDKTLVIYNLETKQEVKIPRVKRSELTYDDRFIIYTIGAPLDSIEYKKRREVKKKDMPKDSLVILDLATFKKEVIPNIKQHKIPKKWSGSLAYEALVQPAEGDSTKKKEEEMFFIHDIITKRIDTFENVGLFEIAEEEPIIVFTRDGNSKDSTAGVFHYNTDDHTMKVLMEEKAKYYNLSISKKGDQVSFITDRDTTKSRIRPYDLYYSDGGQATRIVGAANKLTSNELYITKNTKPRFSEEGSYLFFGIGRHPVLPDSLSLEEEQVQVEVWTTSDPMLYTMQELQEDRLKKETFDVRYNPNDGTLDVLEKDGRESLQVAQKGDGEMYLVSDRDRYGKEVTWMGRSRADIYLGKVGEGAKLFKEGLSGNPGFSPSGRFLVWFDLNDSNWYTYDLDNGEEVNLTEGMSGFTDELNDRPMKPGSYGSAGWTENDEAIIIYDRFDVWRFDPTGQSKPVNLTESRSDQVVWRIIDLDTEEDALEENAFASIFDEASKESGYGRIELNTGEKSIIVKEPFSYDRRPRKARDTDHLLFTKESFEVFPDLVVSSLDFNKTVKISEANPQQEVYRWGTIEIFEWKDLNGEDVEGLLVKPEGFDPSEKYPVIVNFYERSSNGLYRHRAPEPHRSTINYSYYANKGYVIFNPDVKYMIGDPGASAYNAVVSGVEALSKNQWVDKDRIGVQGHSWGGYQIAHLLNKTNIFACAESGAPVVNMVSAYGGIRWGSGMSRMFQYERTQSRLGATLWEDPEAYLRNSPIFEVDKMNTPVLILHNDNDGAVPWYQGIEYYMALRRLGKPAWFLNYNGEPHWPLKWNNRLDFNLRMEQFFAHYLLDQPMPMWMKKGVSVVNKGVNQGFELEEE